jgi:hypothetical protein
MLERNHRLYEAPPVRDRLPTIPHDLSEYARIQTGPSPEAHHDDPLHAMTSGPLVDVWPTDVPCVTGSAAQHAAYLDHREAFVLSMLDGESSLASMLDAVDLPGAEVLAIICDLCARGIVTLDRSGRSALLLG